MTSQSFSSATPCKGKKINILDTPTEVFPFADDNVQNIHVYGRHDRQISLHAYFPIKLFKELVYDEVVTTQTDLDARLHADCTLVDNSLLRWTHSFFL